MEGKPRYRGSPPDGLLLVVADAADLIARFCHEADLLHGRCVGTRPRPHIAHFIHLTFLRDSHHLFAECLAVLVFDLPDVFAFERRMSRDDAVAKF
jgi:hypothetical protein